MVNQETLVIVKPDGIARGLVGEILRRLESNGMKVLKSVLVRLEREWVRELYKGEEEEPYYPEVVSWLSSAPVLLLRVSGVDAIWKVKWEIIGRYPDGIRGEYSENWIKNVAHVPDSPESAARELKLATPLFLGRSQKDMERFRGKTVFALTGMSECGKSTVGRYFDSKGIPRIKIVRMFERVWSKVAPGVDFKQYVDAETERNPIQLWDRFIDELHEEMERRGVSMTSIESLYGGGLGSYLKERLGDSFCLVYIDASEEQRVRFQMIRENLLTLEEARKLLISRDKIKAQSGIPQLKSIADEVVSNEGTLEELHAVMDAVAERHRPS